MHAQARTHTHTQTGTPSPPHTPISMHGHVHANDATCFASICNVANLSLAINHNIVQEVGSVARFLIGEDHRFGIVDQTRDEVNQHQFRWAGVVGVARKGRRAPNINDPHHVCAGVNLKRLHKLQGRAVPQSIHLPRRPRLQHPSTVGVGSQLVERRRNP